MTSPTDSQRLDEIRRRAEAANISKATSLCLNATKVVAWYPYHDNHTVRGPFCRWFQCSEGTKNAPIAEIGDDIEFCAAAMNAYPDYVQGLVDIAWLIEQLAARDAEIEALEEESNALLGLAKAISVNYNTDLPKFHLVHKYRKALERVSSQAGTPDPAEGCRLILQTAKEALKDET